MDKEDSQNEAGKCRLQLVDFFVLHFYCTETLKLIKSMINNLQNLLSNYK